MSMIALAEKYLKAEHPLNSRRAQWLRAYQSKQEDFLDYYKLILSHRRECEAQRVLRKYHGASVGCQIRDLLERVEIGESIQFAGHIISQ